MATITQHAPGTFSWPELATTDQNGAKTFYTSLFGWTFNDNDMGGGEVYTMLQLAGRDLGALYTMRKEEQSTGVPTHWNSYVTVESADASAAKAKSLGGTVFAEPFDVMDVGRMAVIQDPTGAVFCLWQPKKHTGAGVLGEVGSLCWTELMTGDLKKAEAFYTGLFGWKTEPMPGPVQYTVFKRGDQSAGGAMQITPEMGPIPPNWTVYFSVADCDAIAAKTTALGGKIIRPPADIPNIGRFAILTDPQGGVFAVIKLEQMG